MSRRRSRGALAPTRSGRKKRAADESPVAPCPVCLRDRDLSHLGPHAAAAESRWFARWACAECLRAGRALLADPERQVFGYGLPFLAYVDRDAQCTDCGGDFTFAATEQRFWYETLGFVLDSVPRQCPPCRRNRRRRKAAQRALIEALAAVDATSADQVGEVGLRYAEAGHVRKAAEWLRRARNLASSPRQVARWTRRLEELD